jgi:dTDP-4-amino-4,6-dideoxygalactose transaminase
LSAINNLSLLPEMPTRSTPFPPWPYFDADEIDAVRAVLESGRVNYWTGDECRSFEREFADFHGRGHAISLTNGSAALELALYAFDVGVGDEVIVPSRTFIASASCVALRGGIPVVADIDPDSQNLTAETIRVVLTPRTKAIVAVHLGGWPCDMDAIMALAGQHNLCVVEDCAQAHGARLNGRPIGSFGHAAAFSFCQDKIMTTGGEGGMLLLDDDRAWKRAWSFKDHGKSYEKTILRNGGGAFQLLHDTFGTNMRMTEMQAAIGRRQLRKLSAWLAARRRNAESLGRALQTIHGLRVPFPPSNVDHAYYRLYAFVDLTCLAVGWNRDRLMQAINADGVPCFVGSYSEIYREKAFVDAGFGPHLPLPVAAELGETSLAFLVHPTIGEADIRNVAAVVQGVMQRATHPLPSD